MAKTFADAAPGPGHARAAVLGLFWTALLTFAGSAHPQVEDPAAVRGLEIAQESARRDDGFGDTASALIMTLRDARGRETVRAMQSRVLETPSGDRSLLVFDEPKDVRGTALLTHNRANDQDDQWLYLPAVKRVKRIASTSRGGAFMGSEFAYEDFASQEVSKYSYRYLGEEILDGKPCYVIERQPKFSASAYGRQKVWIDVAEYRLMKVEYFDRRDQLLKTLVVEGHSLYLNRFWRPDRMRMTNHRTGRSTTLDFRNYRFANGFSERDFSPARLQQVR